MSELSSCNHAKSETRFLKSVPAAFTLVLLQPYLEVPIKLLFVHCKFGGKDTAQKGGDLFPRLQLFVTSILRNRQGCLSLSKAASMVNAKLDLNGIVQNSTVKFPIQWIVIFTLQAWFVLKNISKYFSNDVQIIIGFLR